MARAASRWPIRRLRLDEEVPHEGGVDMHRDEGRLSSLGGREHAGRLVELTLTEALDTAHQEQEQRGGGLDLRVQRALRSIEPLASFGYPTLGDVDRRHGRQRHARDRFGLPAVALRNCDRLRRDRPLPGQRPRRQECDVGEAADLEVRPSRLDARAPGRARGRVRPRQGDASTARRCRGSSRPPRARRPRGASHRRCWLPARGACGPRRARTRRRRDDERGRAGRWRG